MKITVLRKPEVIDMAGDKVMVDFESGKYFMLRGTANDIWELLQNQTSSQQIIEELLKEYDVDRDTCEKSVLEFLEKLSERGFIRLDK